MPVRKRINSGSSPQSLAGLSRLTCFLTDLGVIEGVPPHEYGTLGISGDFEAGHFRITDVRQPAASTGLRVGDVVTAINGRPVGRLRNVWWEAFGAGKTYRLTLTRGVSVSVTAGS